MPLHVRLGSFVSPCFLVAVLTGTTSAQVVTIPNFVTCLNNNFTVGGQAIDTSKTVSPCVPQACKVTVTMSFFSAQPACILSTTQLPRVIMNCPGAAAGLRYRPSYTLCTPKANDIEVGQDVAPVAPDGPGNMQMADIPVPNGVALTEAYTLNAILSAKTEEGTGDTKGCNACHNDVTPNTTPLGGAAISDPLDPYGSRVLKTNLLPYVIHTTEPNKVAVISKAARMVKDASIPPVNVQITTQSLGAICTQIQNTLANNANAYNSGDSTAPTLALCQALAAYEANQSCGKGAANRSCNGIVGGGLLTNNGVFSSVSLDFSGQATVDGNTITYDPNKIDATLLAFNYADPPGTQVNTVVLQSLVVTVGGGGNYSAVAMGTATIQVGTGAPAPNTPIKVQISLTNRGTTTAVLITNPDGTTTYAGGTAPATLVVFNQN